MKTKKLAFNYLVLFILSLTSISCSSLFDSINSSTSGSNESDEEEAFLSMIEETSDAENSDASDSAFDGASSSDSAFLSSGPLYFSPRYCDDGVEYEVSCDNEAGVLQATVTFDLDCEIFRSSHTISLEGEQNISFTNFSNACNEDGKTLNFSKAVLGKNDENLVFTRVTNPTLTRTISGKNDYELEVTVDIGKTYYDATDEDANGEAESSYLEVSRNVNRKHYKNGELKHDVDVFTSADGFTLADGTVINTTKPIHFITFDQGIDERVIQKDSDLLVDYNAFNVDADETGFRRLFTVTSDEGLKFVKAHCTPYEGTVLSRKFTKNADGSVGEELADAQATMTWSEGKLTVELADGTTFNDLTPRPACTDSDEDE